MERKRYTKCSPWMTNEGIDATMRMCVFACVLAWMHVCVHVYFCLLAALPNFLTPIMVQLVLLTLQ